MNRLLWYVLLVALFTPNLDANSKVRKRVQECLALAESKDAAQRKQAVQDLRSLGISALPYVLPSIAHKKPRVRLVVVQVIASAGAKASGLVPNLVAGMVDKDVKVREAIQSALKQIGRPHSKVLSNLVKLSRHENYNVRLEAVRALGRYEQRGVGAASAIVERLGESDRPQIASAAKKALVAMGKYAVPALLKGTRSSQAKIRSGSVEALATIGEPVSKITPSLNRCLRDPVSGVKLAAIKALGKLGQFSGRNVPNLVDALKDSNSSVQIQAARALGGLGP
ncbi:MAG: HEAT repeat domain-containing protein, partial [Planctomycetota bacterium]|nr:HEAT repeat domain-containing protein [Planctomycetota bacterium]